MRPPSLPPGPAYLMPRVALIPSHQMMCFWARITIYTKDSKHYTKWATVREFM